MIKRYANFFIFLQESEISFFTPFWVNISRKIFLMLLDINGPNFIAWLPLLLEILNNMYIVITCCPVCDVINFEINLSFLKAGLLYNEMVIKFFFRQFPFNVKYVYTAAKCEWNFSIYNHESISEEKIFTRFLIKIFSSEIHFTNQRSNLYWKWRKWLMWGEHERRNEWKFKNIRMKRK